MVDAETPPVTVPPGNIKAGLMEMFTGYPSTTFDFFPYSSIHRPEILLALPKTYIKDVTVVTKIEGETGVVKVSVPQSGKPLSGRIILKGQEKIYEEPLSGSQEVFLRVPSARFWGPDDPFLYDLTITLEKAEGVVFRYTLIIGIRTIEVSGDQILLNGEPIKLRGFRKHEDLPIHGRGLGVPVIVSQRWQLICCVYAGIKNLKIDC